MRILLLTTGHSSTDGRIFHREAYSLKNAGHQVVILAKGEKNCVREIEGIQIIEIATLRHKPRGIVRQAKMFAQAKKIKPDVIHCHDWQTGLVPALLKGPYSDRSTLDGTPSVFTIHNIGYQGIFPEEKLSVTGLSRSDLKESACVSLNAVWEKKVKRSRLS